MGCGSTDGRDIVPATYCVPARAGVASSGCEQSSVRIEPLIVLTADVGGLPSNAVLVDSGATSNFVSARFLEGRNLTLTTSPLAVPLNVSLADGSGITCTSCCRAVPLVLDGHHGQHDLVVVPHLGDYDVILGRTFLVDSGAQW